MGHEKCRLLRCAKRPGMTGNKSHTFRCMGLCWYAQRGHCKLMLDRNSKFASWRVKRQLPSRNVESEWRKNLTKQVQTIQHTIELVMLTVQYRQSPSPRSPYNGRYASLFFSAYFSAGVLLTPAPAPGSGIWCGSG